MKRFFVLVTILMQGYAMFSQDNDWTYRVNFRETGEKADSVTYYTGVYIDLNPLVTIDSSRLIITIGSDVGLNDIFYREYTYTPAIFSDHSVTLVNGIPVFYLGKYIIPETAPFIVDMIIKGP